MEKLRISYGMLIMLLPHVVGAAASEPSESVVAIASATPGISSSVLEQRRRSRETLLREVSRIVQDSGASHPEAPAHIAAWVLPYVTHRRVIPLPGLGRPFPADSPFTKSPLGDAWDQARRRYAGELVTLFSQCQDDPELLVDLALEALREDPHEVNAQKVLQRELPQYTWQAKTVRDRKGTSRSKELGWGAGQYWWLTSPHYSLVTNGSVAQGRQLVEQLEQLHAAVQPLLLAGPHAPRVPKQRRPLRVVLFADRQQYIHQLQPSIPQISATIGYYDPRDKTCYFYITDDTSLSTVLHEGTHQLLHEVHMPKHAVGEQCDFWVVEGIALYMESCTLGLGYATVGGVDAGRLQFARYRGLRERDSVPLETLCHMGRTEFQQHPELAKLYTQVAGFTHFLMDGAGGAHRAAFLNYLHDVYESSQPAVDAWRTASGRTWSELEEAYRSYLQLEPGALQALLPRTTSSLCLGDTRIDATDLAAVAEYRNLEWLDLAHLPAEDALLSQLGVQSRLRQLNLEGTRITAASLAPIATWSNLEELDLSSIPLAEADWSRLAALRNLKVLWLTQSGATDACVETLSQLTKLENLQLQGTSITAAGLAKLRAALPQAEIVGP